MQYAIPTHQGLAFDFGLQRLQNYWAFQCPLDSWSSCSLVGIKAKDLLPSCKLKVKMLPPPYRLEISFSSIFDPIINSLKHLYYSRGTKWGWIGHTPIGKKGFLLNPNMDVTNPEYGKNGMWIKSIDGVISNNDCFGPKWAAMYIQANTNDVVMNIKIIAHCLKIDK